MALIKALRTGIPKKDTRFSKLKALSTGIPKKRHSNLKIENTPNLLGYLSDEREDKIIENINPRYFKNRAFMGHAAFIQLH